MTKAPRAPGNVRGVGMRVPFLARRTGDPLWRETLGLAAAWPGTCMWRRGDGCTINIYMVMYACMYVCSDVRANITANDDGRETPRYKMATLRAKVVEVAKVQVVSVKSSIAAAALMLLTRVAVQAVVPPMALQIMKCGLWRSVDGSGECTPHPPVNPPSLQATSIHKLFWNVSSDRFQTMTHSQRGRTYIPQHQYSENYSLLTLVKLSDFTQQTIPP